MSRQGADERHDLLIAGERVQPAAGEYAETRDPANGEAFASVAVAGPTDVDEAVAAARAAFPEWRDRDPAERGRTLYRVAELIRDHAEELAALETRDQGKPRSQARSDVLSGARYFEYYAGCADKLEGTTVPVGTGQVDYTVREPYGVSAQVVPWNFPGNLFCRGVAPALAAGNATVVKPAPTTPLSAFSGASSSRPAERPLVPTAVRSSTVGMPPSVPGVSSPTRASASTLRARASSSASCAASASTERKRCSPRSRSTSSTPSACP